MTPRRYWVSTAVEALAAAAKTTRNVTTGELVRRYGALATNDKVICDMYRLSLHSIITRAWEKRRRLTSLVVDELECYPETDIVEERGLIELGETNCCPKEECSLAAAFRREQDAIETMRSTIDAQPSKPENIRRAKVLRQLARPTKRRLTPQQCRHLGDAVFAFFCPKDATILTTNAKDLEPLARALDKKVEMP
jgi:hypothetical protein